LICTSAGEVGVDISADHLVCDLTPLDSMAQRFGRVNRRGAGAAKIDVVHESRSDERRSESAYDDARWATLKALRKLPPCDWITDRCDGSPKALGELIEGLSVRNRQAAFTPQPTILPTSDILFDAWALTTIREPLPGRPPVSDWLHGLAGWEPPDTYLAWREEVDVLKDLALTQEQLEDLLGDYPLKPHELLRDRTDRVFEQLTTCHERLQTRNLEPLVWIIDPFGTISRRPLSQLIARDKQKKPLVNLNGCTVLLPSSAGGLSKGMLNGDVHYTANHPGGEHVGYDVADKWFDEQGRPRRQRVWDDAGTPEGMRLVRIIDTDPNPDRGDSGEDERPARRFWKWYVRPRSADDEGSQSAFEPQALDEHHQRARMAAQRIAAALQLEEPEATALAFAAAWHDKGKNRSVWQQSIRNRDYPKQVLAKSGNNKLPLDLNHYRHEFGSLLDVHDPSETSELVGQPENVRDLVLHLIAAHHGRARPHFPEPEAFDPERPESVGRELANEVPQRFARLQRRYGRWGLAWLESLVRAADVIASQPESESAP
jgi:CRISPR-associated endonuclease/helicase Cas3